MTSKNRIKFENATTNMLLNLTFENKTQKLLLFFQLFFIFNYFGSTLNMHAQIILHTCII